MLQPTTREIIVDNPKNLLGSHFLQYTYVNAVTREIIQNKSWKLLQEKSLQYLQTITRESFQTMLTNYYHRNHCKLCLQKFIKELNLFQAILPIYST